MAGTSVYRPFCFVINPIGSFLPETGTAHENALSNRRNRAVFQHHDGNRNSCDAAGPPTYSSRALCLPILCVLSAARNVSVNAGIRERELTHETSFVGQYCGLLVPIDHPDRQCKRLSRRGSIGRRCRAYDPPYLSRYFWRLCWWMVRAPPLHKMASRASKRQPYSICR